MFESIGDAIGLALAQNKGPPILDSTAVLCEQMAPELEIRVK